MFNPFKYQYTATLLRQEGDMVVARIQSGTTDVEMKIPAAHIPKEVQMGQQFMLTLQPLESAQDKEFHTLKRLLEELIH